MKKVLFFTAFILFAGLNSLLAQSVLIHPIPTYNCPLVEMNTGFEEMPLHATPGKEKRDMEIEITSSSTWFSAVYAKVYLVKQSTGYTKGPYFVYLNQTLSIPIDNEQWGVLIRCNWQVSASVWID